MPPRPSHLPHTIERAALQKLLVRSSADLHPAGKKTILRMIEKGWIKGPLAGGQFEITVSGEAALKAQLPIKRQ